MRHVCAYIQYVCGVCVCMCVCARARARAHGQVYPDELRVSSFPVCLCVFFHSRRREEKGCRSLNGLNLNRAHQNTNTAAVW